MDIREFYKEHDYDEMVKLLENTNLYSYQKQTILKKYVDLVNEIAISCIYNEFGGITK